jgi:thiamine biosynthesis lipoprotein
MERLIALLDHRRPDAALARLNRDGRLDGAPPALTELLQQAIAYGELTGGAFDVTIKPLADALRSGNLASGSLASGAREALRARVDYRQIAVEGESIRLAIPGAAVTLDGIAKGRVIDEGIAALRQHGFDDILVEAGGDLRAVGVRSDGAAWQVGIAHPRRPAGDLLARLALSGAAAATSGDYMNHVAADFSEHHILDPQTGHSPRDLASVTVVAPTALQADALATALMVLGSQAGLSLAEGMEGVEAVLVTKQMHVHHTSGARLL